MALAYLQYKGSNRADHLFLADIGSNQVYSYKIGKKYFSRGGLDRLEEIVYQSPLKRLAPGFQQRIQTDFVLRVPHQFFRDRARFIQLFSFRNPSGLAPAVSEVVAVLPAVIAPQDGRFPAWSFSVSESLIMKKFEVGNKSFCYSEPPVARAMFWDKIVSALPQIVETALPVVKKLIGGNKTNGSSNGQNTSPKSDEILNAIAELLKNLAKDQNTSASAQTLSVSESMAINPAMLTQLAPLLEKVLSPESINAIGNQPVKLFKAIGDSVLKMDKQEMKHLERLNPGVDDPAILPILNSMSMGHKKYATAKVAPALLAALPALMPVIEKALDPKMIEAIGNQPLKLFKAIGDAALKMDKQEMEHLERLNPGVDDPTILPILNSMSMIPALGKKSIPFKIDPGWELKFEEVEMIEINGQKKVAYSTQKIARIPIRILTEQNKVPRRPLPRAIIQLFIQDGDSMAVLLEKKFKLRNIHPGQVFYDLILEPAELKALPANQDLKIEVSFLWKSSKSGKNLGVFKNHYITLIDDYSFDRIGETVGEPIPLNDLVKYRPFWHKVWEGGYTDSRRWEIDFNIKYYYVLDLEGKKAHRLSTRKKIQSDNASAGEDPPYRRKVQARMKSGMEVTLEMMNTLLESVGPEPLSSQQLQALKSSELQSYFNQTARVHVEMKGESGDTGTLWVYPEVSIHEIKLHKITQSNEHGMVVQTVAETVQFPRPAAIHFIGTKSM
ncbi:MAG TPA: hypothetical protein VJ953_21700 [Saprospiraceae bacterium]|nr:hypothetical protein [Saprospiraceae bacterium]